MSEQNVMQLGSDAEPVVEDASLPAMGGEAGPDIMVESAAAEQSNLMTEPAPEGKDGDEEAGYEDMEPPQEDEFPSGAEFTAGTDAASFEAGPQGEGYLRLVVSVNGDEMTVTDASVVGGELVQQPDLTGQMAYQAVIEGRRVAAEAFADLGLASSFAPPDDEEKGHCLTETSQFDFVVRIPRSEVTLDQLADLEIELVRPTRSTELSTDTPPPPSVPFAAAAIDAGAEPPKVVARLSGVKLDELPSKAADALRRGLR